MGDINFDTIKINPTHWARHWLSGLGISEEWVSALTIILDILLLIIVSFTADFIARRIFLSVVKRFVQRTKATWDDYFFEQRVFKNVAHLIPAFIVYWSIPRIFDDLDYVINPLLTGTKIFLLILGVIIVNKVLKALTHLTENHDNFKDKPVRTVFQVMQVMTTFIAIIALISIATGVNLNTLLGALAGTTAILILIFQDTINGLLANFQISMYDLLRKGDWITFDKFGVDGDVQSIDLTTVKIRNFDNTISSVPAKAFVNDSFINWRGMKNAQVRRIKRNILIDINSISFVDVEKLKTFSQYHLVKEYIDDRQSQIDEYNTAREIDKSVELNGRHQTNIGIYRAYIKKYLEEHPYISNQHMAMVRQLQPNPQGVPLEVYCFCADIVWENYEQIQSDLFDHLFAATKYFGLRLYQAPSGSDLQFLKPSAEA